MLTGSRPRLPAFALLVGSVLVACGTPTFVVVAGDGGSPEGGPRDGSLDVSGMSDAPPLDDGARDAPSRYSAPTTLVSGEMQPKGITVDPDRLFWVEAATGDVRTFDKLTSAVTSIAKSQPQPLDIAVDSTTLYWSVATATPTKTSQCMAMKMLKTSGAPSCLTSAALMTGRLALSGGNVFLSGESSGDLTFVGFAATTSANATLPETLTPATQAVAGDGSDVFVGDGPHVDTFSITVAGTGLQGEPALCNNNAICGGTGTTVDIVVSAAGAVFWVTSNGQVMSATPGPNVAPTMLGMVPMGAQRMAVDASYVYVTSSSGTTTGGAITAVPVAPGATRTLASGEDSPFGITVDVNNVYWTCGNGTIRAVGVPL